MSRRERLSAIITAIPFLILACLAQPRRTIVDGREIVEIIAFGRVVPKTTLFLIGGIVIVATWYGVDRLLNAIWPEKTTVTVDKLYERPDGGYVAWKGDDPEAGSPMDYAEPRLFSALDYLQAEEPPPIRVLLLGIDEAQEETNRFNEELARWLRESPDEILYDLLDAACRMEAPLEDEVVWRITEAYEVRGIPTLEVLSAFAEETQCETLLDYLRDRKESGA